MRKSRFILPTMNKNALLSKAASNPHDQPECSYDNQPQFSLAFGFRTI